MVFRWYRIDILLYSLSQMQYIMILLAFIFKKKPLVNPCDVEIYIAKEKITKFRLS